MSRKVNSVAVAVENDVEEMLIKNAPPERRKMLRLFKKARDNYERSGKRFLTAEEINAEVAARRGGNHHA